MLELAGYYDGASVRLMEVANIKKYQALKIIVTDEFVDKMSLSQNMEQTHITAKEKAQKAYERFLSHAKPGIGSGDYKKDLMEMLGKKYEDVD